MGCAHELCVCEDAPVLRGDIAFCSEPCADAYESGVEEMCPCGHPECDPV